VCGADPDGYAPPDTFVLITVKPEAAMLQEEVPDDQKLLLPDIGDVRHGLNNDRL
jgi:hypothetical protein